MFLKELFEKVNLEKKWTTKKHAKLPSKQKIKIKLGLMVLKVLGGMRIVALSISSHEQTQ